MGEYVFTKLEDKRKVLRSFSQLRSLSKKTRGFTLKHGLFAVMPQFLQRNVRLNLHIPSNATKLRKGKATQENKEQQPPEQKRPGNLKEHTVRHGKGKGQSYMRGG